MPALVYSVRFPRSMISSAEIASPKHIPDAINCSMSTLWKLSKRGLREILLIPMHPIKMGIKIPAKSGLRLRMRKVCQMG